MFFSLFVSFLCLLIVYLDKIGACKNGLKKSFFILFLFLSLRYDFGNDYKGYLDNYLILGGLDDDEFYFRVNEVGWVYINFFFKRLFGLPGFHLLIALVSGFNCFVAYRFFRKYLPKEYYFFALALYILEPNNVFVLSSAIRQSIAVSFFLISVDYLIRKKYLYYFLIVLIGSLFHTTILVFIPLVIFNIVRWRIRLIYIIVLFIALFFLITRSAELFSQLDLLFTLSDFGYQSYTTEGQDLQRIGLGFILSLIIFFIVFYYNRNSTEDTRNTIVKFVLLSALFLVLGLVLNMTARLNYYIFPIVIIAYVYTIQKLLTKPLFRSAFIFLLIAFYLYQYILFWISPVYGPYFKEYKTIFQSPYIG